MDRFENCCILFVKNRRAYAKSGVCRRNRGERPDICNYSCNICVTASCTKQRLRGRVRPNDSSKGYLVASRQ